MIKIRTLEALLAQAWASVSSRHLKAEAGQGYLPLKNGPSLRRLQGRMRKNMEGSTYTRRLFPIH